MHKYVDGALENQHRAVLNVRNTPMRSYYCCVADDIIVLDLFFLNHVTLQGLPKGEEWTAPMSIRLELDHVTSSGQ
jgi:hypothetical protein